MTKKPGINCSFCKKNQTEVEKIVAGPNVYICNECIVLVSDIVSDNTDGDGMRSTRTWGLFRAQDIFKKTPAKPLCDALSPDATIADLLEAVDRIDETQPRPESE